MTRDILLNYNKVNQSGVGNTNLNADSNIIKISTKLLESIEVSNSPELINLSSQIIIYIYKSNLNLFDEIKTVKDSYLRAEEELFSRSPDDDEIIKVLKLVCLDKLFEKLEDGLDTELGEKGIRMSGGERQRVALARLFFDDSKLIILDEATSAMDNITEKTVMENVLKHLDDKTLIVIAHRLETIKDVDKIYVLSDGVIQEEGKYKELLDKKGYFTKLYESIKN